MSRAARGLRRAVGIAACAVALAFPLWLLAGWLGWVTAPVEVFGVPGLRTPAGVTVAALLVAAIAFWNEPFL